MNIHNFSAGPCILPKSVMKKAAESVVNYNNTGLSIMEMSHRSKDFVAVMNKAIALVKELMNVPDNYDVIFLQGGASAQFYMTALNLLPVNGKAAYINTGTWAEKAIKEASLIGDIVEVASSKDRNFSYIPKKNEIPADCSYLHYTTNNTIFGTQFKAMPKTNIPIIADMSSDILSQKVDVSKFDLIYAGVQKNIGPAGATLVIIKKGILGKTGRVLPNIMDYQNHIEKESMFNTPPCFSIYVSMLTMEWLKELGGVEEIEKSNIKKAAVLYAEVDRNSLFQGTSALEDRSLMNPTFKLLNEDLNPAFLQKTIEAGISGVRGHRSVGGYRASMYNALPLSSVEILVKVMQDFETFNA
jgi:phosphoserine aminotransferase